MDIESIPARTDTGDVHAFIEIPKGSQNKYEYNKALGVVMLDRALYSAVHFPTDYGFVPNTRSSDGEYLDIMVMVEQPTFPGCLAEVRLLGVLTITKSSGKPEQKLLAVPCKEPRYQNLRDLDDVGEFTRQEIEQFFAVYKELEGSDVGVVGWEGIEAARRILDEAVQAAEENPPTEA